LDGRAAKSVAHQLMAKTDAEARRFAVEK